MKKKAILTMIILALSLSAGCGNAKNSQISSSATEKTSEDNSTGGLAAEFSFADVSDRLFIFCSGVGAWDTELFINSDGSFEGLFHDSDMGDCGEGYPGGTIYSCNFKGRFDSLEKVDEFTFKMKLVSLEFKQEPGKEKLENDIRYIYSTAYGLDDGEEFYLYLPGAKLAQLPEEYLRWVGYYRYYDLEETAEAELPFYGLYNVNTGNGFSSCEYERTEEEKSEK